MAKYRVLGNREVLGHRPGQEFVADISDIQEERLVKGGHIERVARSITVELREDFPRKSTEELPDDRAGATDKKE